MALEVQTTRDAKEIIVSIEKKSTNDLLYLLQRQFPEGVTTFAPCPICGTGARGGNYCAQCICSELTRRGVPASLVESMSAMLNQRTELNWRIAYTVESMLAQATLT